MSILDKIQQELLAILENDLATGSKNLELSKKIPEFISKIKIYCTEYPDKRKFLDILVELDHDEVKASFIPILNRDLSLMKINNELWPVFYETLFIITKLNLLIEESKEKLESKTAEWRDQRVALSTYRENLTLFKKNSTLTILETLKDLLKPLLRTINFLMTNDQTKSQVEPYHKIYQKIYIETSRSGFENSFNGGNTFAAKLSQQGTASSSEGINPLLIITENFSSQLNQLAVTGRAHDENILSTVLGICSAKTFSLSTELNTQLFENLIMAILSPHHEAVFQWCREKIPFLSSRTGFLLLAFLQLEEFAKREANILSGAELTRAVGGHFDSFISNSLSPNLQTKAIELINQVLPKIQDTRHLSFKLAEWLDLLPISPITLAIFNAMCPKDIRGEANAIIELRGIRMELLRLTLPLSLPLEPKTINDFLDAYKSLKRLKVVESVKPNMAILLNNHELDEEQWDKIEHLIPLEIATTFFSMALQSDRNHASAKHRLYTLIENDEHTEWANLQLVCSLNDWSKMDDLLRDNVESAKKVIVAALESPVSQTDAVKILFQIANDNENRDYLWATEQLLQLENNIDSPDLLNWIERAKFSNNNLILQLIREEMLIDSKRKNIPTVFLESLTPEEIQTLKEDQTVFSKEQRQANLEERIKQNSPLRRWVLEYKATEDGPMQPMEILKKFYDDHPHLQQIIQRKFAELGLSIPTSNEQSLEDYKVTIFLEIPNYLRSKTASTAEENMLMSPRKFNLLSPTDSGSTSGLGTHGGFGRYGSLKSNASSSSSGSNTPPNTL